MKSTLTETQGKRLCRTLREVAHDVLASTPYLPLAVEVDDAMGRLTLQIFIEKRDTRVTVDDCAGVSLLLEAPVAELAELQAHSYVLEVSSPGLFRHLQTVQEFEFYLGKTVTLKPLDVPESKATSGLFPKYQLQGVTPVAEDLSITLKTESGEMETLLLSSIATGQGLCLAPAIQWPNDEEAPDLPEEDEA